MTTKTTSFVHRIMLPSCIRAMTAGRWLSKRGKYIPLGPWLNCKDCFERNEHLLVSGVKRFTLF